MTPSMALLERAATVSRDSAPEGDSAEWWPLTFRQEAALLADEWSRSVDAPPIYNHVPIALRIDGPLEADALQGALDEIIRRHRGLTATYHATDVYPDGHRRTLLEMFSRTWVFVPGLFGQWLYPEATIKVRYRVLDPFLEDVDETTLARLAQEEGFEPLPLDTPPVMRATVLSCNRTTHLLVLTVSHLNFDGWAARILRHELIALYDATISGRRCVLPPVTSHAGEFAAQEHRRFRSGEMRRDAAYWTERSPEVSLGLVRHADLPWSIDSAIGIQLEKQARAATIGRRLDGAQSQRIRAFARDHRITPYVFVRTACVLKLRRHTGRQRVAFWANFANRSGAAAEWMIASCVHPHLLSPCVSPESTLEHACRAVAAEIAEAREHQAVSHAAFPLLGVPAKGTSDARITVDVWPSDAQTDSRMRPVFVPAGRRWVDFDLRLREEDGEFVLYATYQTSRYDAGGVQAMLDDLARSI